VDLVARLLVKSGSCRIRFWYVVAPGSGISRETSRNCFWNLTVEAAAIERAGQRLQPVAAPIDHLGSVDLAALPISTFEKGCRVVRGLLPLRLAHLEELFSDSVLGHVAELIEDCQNGRTTNVTFL
jgi:hypothetical protein